jgi:hypothetical protein
MKNNSQSDAIMCAIIVKSIKNIPQIPAKIKLGIDRKINIANGDSKMTVIEENLLNDVIIGGPTCTYQGNTIPCFIGYSTNSSIALQMLANMLEVLDTSCIFDQTDG